MLSIERGLAVILSFREGRTRMSISDVARATGISRGAVRRCFCTLTELGYVAPLRHAYELTPAVLKLGYSRLGPSAVFDEAQPVLDRLSELLQASCSLAVLEGDDVAFVACSGARYLRFAPVSVGSRLPAACTSFGRVLMANADEAVRSNFVARVNVVRHTAQTLMDKNEMRLELERVRAQGFAIVEEEVEVGLRALAVPVRRSDGATIAALGVGVRATHADRLQLQRQMLPALLTAARELGATIGPSV